MINLLPTDTKRDISAARTNVVLLRYNILTVVAIAGLAVTCAAFYAVLGLEQASSVAKSDENSAKAASYAKVRQAADSYRNDLSVASKILDNSVNYTSVIFAITQLLPTGVILDSIDLNATDFGQQKTFTAYAKSYAQATQLKENFQKSDLFTNVYFTNITDSSGSDTNGPYPYTVEFSAQLKKVATQ